MILGGVGEAFILKYVGGKIVAAIGSKVTAGMATHLAHSTAAATTHFAMHSAINTMGAVSSTTTAAGALHVLGQSADANYKLAKAVLEKKMKLEGRSDVAAQLASLGEEQIALLLLSITMHALAEGFYENLKHDGTMGTRKTTLDEMEPCRFSGCDCPDYDQGGDECMHCDHDAAYHRKVSEAEIESGEAVNWLVVAMAAEVYPLLENRNGEGQLKLFLQEVDTCDSQVCPCWDFDLCEANQFFSRRCSCGHRWREHTVTGAYEWIVLGLAESMVHRLVSEL